MIISHKKKFAAFRPWKCASSTLSARLEPYDQSPYSRFYHFNPHLGRVTHQHLTCADFAALPESKLGYFTFTFVRHPYDRVYSGFQQFFRDIDWQPKASFPSNWVKQLVLSQLASNFAQLARALFDFDTWWASVDEHQIYNAGANSSFPLHPAHYWTHIDGTQYVDSIGKVENFETDVEAICSRLEIPVPEKQNVNLSGESVGVSLDPNQTYYSSRMNRASLDKINAIFARDFQLFDYKKL
jgi:Sulfotransferase family